MHRVPVHDALGLDARAAHVSAAAQAELAPDTIGDGFGADDAFHDAAGVGRFRGRDGF